jgi:DNA-binding PadR family transcriptional regulator
MAVREGLMALLAEEPRYGYQLKTAFESATGGVWNLNVGQVYTTLDRLQRGGLVDVDDSGEQKRYSLTTDGEDALGAWWRAVPADDPPPRDELQLKVLLALDRGARHALAVITRQRTAITRLLQQHRRSRQGSGEPLPQALVADALVVRAEADLRWLDLCESRILRERDADNTRPERDGGRGRGRRANPRTNPRTDGGAS